ncbi:hypothetical protein BKA70DRAFT_1569632 [Coprinopsis sp. MPI-PUGE-AT-0042]|nr:hypothetical protein BKA70DRAFT_1569632 [Coprinopsis sp. MPI-PUGE-AT-0042]
MSSLLSSHESAIKLLFDARTYVAGERISGVVELDFRMVLEDKIEQVRVKLRGSASTYTNHPQVGTTNHHLSALLFLWPMATQSYGIRLRATILPPGTHIIQLPFEFQIPTDSPSSFHAIRYPQEATISYGIEVVADRHGLFRFKRRIGYVFPVLSRASREEVENAFQLRQGWPGEWRGFEHSEQIRKHLWGDRSSVQAQLQLPAVGSFPVGIPIPISLMRSQLALINHFSLRPRKVPDGVSFLLDAIVNITAQGQPGLINDHLPSPVVGFGESETSSCNVQVAHSEPVWLPEKGEEGKWKRQVTFDTIMVLKCPPTIDLGIIQCSYVLKIEIPFPGIGNNLEFQTPINVNSGFGPFDPNGPAPQALDLPPSYFTGEHHDWDGDGKSG